MPYLSDLFFFLLTQPFLPTQRASSHKVFRRLGRKFAFQSTCFRCYCVPLQNPSGDESVLENIDFFILSWGGKSLCVNKIREHVQWKHTWSIKHNVKQLLLKCHSKPGPQKNKKTKQKKISKQNHLTCVQPRGDAASFLEQRMPNILVSGFEQPPPYWFMFMWEQRARIKIPHLKYLWQRFPSTVGLYYEFVTIKQPNYFLF